MLPALRARTLSDALVKGMGRSNGYRPNKANEEEVLRLRARLGKVRASEWQRAGCIMQQITSLIGKQGGPGNGMISPRACTGCGYYGHTKQWCKVKRARDADSELAIDEDRVWRVRNGVVPTATGKVDQAWCAWYAWSWRRYNAARAAGGGCEQATVCGQCEGCAKWASAVSAFERADPEPKHSPWCAEPV